MCNRLFIVCFQHLTEEQFLILREWYSFMMRQYACLIPDLIIYLRASPEVVFARMQGRARKEETSVSLGYLQKIHGLYEAWLNDPKSYHPMGKMPGNGTELCEDHAEGSIYHASSLSQMFGGTVRVLIVDSNQDFAGVWSQLKPVLDQMVKDGPHIERPHLLYVKKFERPRVLQVIKLSPKGQLPERATPGSAGFDLFRYVTSSHKMFVSF